jgi:CheY-like chemotaxis protein
MKVLLVEDDKFLRRVLEKKLINEGLEVITAVDGEEALAKIVQDRPEVILLDIILPKKSGFVILETINKDPNLKKIPIVVISNLSQEEDIRKALSLGVSEYLVKAKVSLDDVIKRIKEYAGSPAQ